jgi:hypothetical protein
MGTHLNTILALGSFTSKFPMRSELKCLVEATQIFVLLKMHGLASSMWLSCELGKSKEKKKERACK